MSAEVKRVWGKADDLSLEFNYVGGDEWQTRVPPETKDGIYACELWAINSIGELGHWTGELYMCSGVCCVPFRHGGRKRQSPDLGLCAGGALYSRSGLKSPG